MEKELLVEAQEWFAKTFGGSCKEKGFPCVRVWYRPIFFKKQAEVVFGMNEEAVDAFVEIQSRLYKSLRWLMFYLIMAVPLECLAVKWFGAVGFWSILALTVAVGMAFVMFPRYLRRKEKLYQGKVIVYSVREWE